MSKVMVTLTLWCHQSLLITEVRSRSGQKGQFANQYFCTRSTRSQVKGANFQIDIFAQEAHVSDSEFPQDFKYFITFLLWCVEVTNIASQKNWRHTFFAMHCYKTPKTDIFLQFCMFIFNMQFLNMLHAFFESYKILDFITVFLKIVF